MTKAVMTVDPRLWDMLGSKMYSLHPIVLLVRELMQNAEDACKRKGVEPKITITVKQISRDPTRWLVICEDNGDGMSVDDIVSKFLKMAGKKDAIIDVKQTGGFGIAKLILIILKSWSVWSRNNYLNKEIFLEGDDIIETKPYKDGTKIRAIVDCSAKPFYYEDVSMAYAMIFLSDVDVTFKFKQIGYQWKIMKHAGFNSLDIEKKDYRLLEENENFDLHGIMPTEMFTRKTNGWNAYRLNGLVQFCDVPWNSDRETTLIFDIKTDVEPEHPDYPFTASREKLTNNIHEMTDSIVRVHNANVLESKIVIVKEPPPAEEQVIVRPGRLLSGSRKTRFKEEEHDHTGTIGSKVSTKFVAKIEGVEDKAISGFPQLVLMRYKKDPAKAKRYAKILRAWAEVLTVVASEEETFGIGITSDTGTKARRAVLDGTIYYILNPSNFDSITGKRAIAMKLWHTATHETSHKYIHHHNEALTTTMDDIADGTVEAFDEHLDKIVRLL